MVLQKLKRIIWYLAVQRRIEKLKGPIFVLVGPLEWEKHLLENQLPGLLVEIC